MHCGGSNFLELAKRAMPQALVPCTTGNSLPSPRNRAGWRAPMNEDSIPARAGELIEYASMSSIATQHSIPEEMDHPEVAVSMPMVNEVQLLMASEPRISLKA